MASSGHMEIGEVRTYMVGERVLTVRRTKRDYIHDLCDALNGSIANPQVEWIVRGNGLALRGTRQGGLGFSSSPAQPSFEDELV